jgi:acyl carrier protein
MADEILSDVTELLRDIFDDPSLQVTGETTAKDVPGWDSMKQVMILMAVEEKFEIQLSTREMDRLKNVGDLVAAIASLPTPIWRTARLRFQPACRRRAGLSAKRFCARIATWRATFRIAGCMGCCGGSFGPAECAAHFTFWAS